MLSQFNKDLLKVSIITGSIALVASITIPTMILGFDLVGSLIGSAIGIAPLIVLNIVVWFRERNRLHRLAEQRKIRRGQLEGNR